MGQGWLKEILDENRKTVEDWPEWKKSQQSTNTSDRKEETTVSVKASKPKG